VDSLTANAVDASNSFQDKFYGYGTMLFKRNGSTYAIGHTGTAASNANVLCQLKPSNIYVCFSFNIIRANRELFLDRIDNYLSTLTLNPTTETPTIPTAINDELHFNVSFYPNPASDKINIRLPNNKKYQISIYNYLGQSEMELFADKIENNIDLTRLIDGIYFVKVGNINGNSTIKKLIVKR
jgi:hypothetical protein